MEPPCPLLQLSALGAWAVSKNHRNALKRRKLDSCDCSERIGRCTSGDDWYRTHLVCESWNRLVRSYSYLRLVPGRCRKIIEMHSSAENWTLVIVASGLEGVRAEMIGPQRIWYVNHGTALSAPTAICAWCLGGVEKSSKCTQAQKIGLL